MPQLLGRWRPFRLYRLVFRRGQTLSFLRAAMNPSSSVVPQAAAAVPGAISASARGRVFRLARHALPLRHAAHLDREQRHEPPAPGPHASRPAQPPNPRDIGSQGGFFFCSGVGADRVNLDTPTPTPTPNNMDAWSSDPMHLPKQHGRLSGCAAVVQSGAGARMEMAGVECLQQPGMQPRPAGLPSGPKRGPSWLIMPQHHTTCSTSCSPTQEDCMRRKHKCPYAAFPPPPPGTISGRWLATRKLSWTYSCKPAARHRYHVCASTKRRDACGASLSVECRVHDIELPSKGGGGVLTHAHDIHRWHGQPETRKIREAWRRGRVHSHGGASRGGRLVPADKHTCRSALFSVVPSPERAFYPIHAHTPSAPIEDPPHRNQAPPQILKPKH
eukprot:scaffold2187_cov109-Isochrysis_galbana.AAC.5